MQSISLPPQPLLWEAELCFAELPWPASKQMIPQSEPGVEVVMWGKREIAFQFRSLQPVGDTAGAPWWGRAVSFGALLGRAAQEQFPPGPGGRKRLQAHRRGGRAARPWMEASCKLGYMWWSRQCFGCSRGLAGPLKGWPGKCVSGEGTALFFVPLVGHVWWCEGGIFSLPMSREAS